ncbi:MAG TPA: fasciclin domain-containing protein [Tepidisphaeraceae bacterium]|nr:fasciclin domain-containing protein [Tepidisphaeraceae bacterium]
MRSKLPMFLAVAALGLGSGFVALTGPNSVLADQAMKGKDIIDVATAPGMTDVTTLVTAIKAAGLVDALKGDGPFTVFAPTNEAFAKLPKATLDDLLKPENKEKLKAILLYHVHAGAAVKAADVKTMKLSTLNGKELDVKVEGGNVMINNAKVIKTDVMGSNGVIHLIDTVVLPPG